MRQQAKRSKSSQTYPMTSMKSHGHLNSIRETSEEHQQRSPARQTAAQHHYGSASATSNPPGAEFIPSNIRSQQNIIYTTGSQNLTSAVEPHDDYPSVPHPQQQPNRPSRYFTHHSTSTHDYRGLLSPRLGSAFDAATQFRNPTHQSPTVTGRNAYGAREAMQAPSEQNSLYSDEDCFNEFIHQDVCENLHGQLPRSIDTVPGKPMAPTAFGQAHKALTGLGNDEPPWSSIDQRQHRQSTEPMLPRTFNFHDVAFVGESAYPYPGDLTRSSHVSAFNQEIGNLIQNNHQATSGYGNQQINGSPETVRQPHFPEHGYQQEPPPSDSNLVNVGTYPPASSSNARSSATASSTTPDPLPCSLCPKYFRGKYRRGNRSRHMRLKHGVKEEKYKCLVESCGKSFSRNDALLKHSRKRHPELRIAEPVRRKEEPNSMQNTVDQHNSSYSHSNQSSNIGQLFQTQPHSGGSLIQYDDDLRGVTGRL